ncbi:hypothetical protein D6833_12565 [Candidatus Parcubacteria bacterium]|nr:MAG: hypothetical protein D6833_12565 [Candidatus Parcubacteria bacterium]
MSYQNVKFWRLVLLAALLGYLGGQIVHEAGHWAVLEIYRRSPVMSFTGLVQQDETPNHPEGWSQFTAPDGEQVWLHLATLPGSDTEWVLMLAAGPLAQVAAMLFGFALVHFGEREQVKVIGLLLALLNSFGPMLYQSRSMLGRGGGDEYLITQFLGVPAAAVHVLFLAVATAGLVVGMWNLAGWRTRLKWLGAVCIGFVGQGPLLMYANRITRTQVGLGNPFFRPVLGWSLPVVIVSVVAGLALVVVLMRWENMGSMT